MTPPPRPPHLIRAPRGVGIEQTAGSANLRFATDLYHALADDAILLDAPDEQLPPGVRPSATPFQTQTFLWEAMRAGLLPAADYRLLYPDADLEQPPKAPIPLDSERR